MNRQNDKRKHRTISDMLQPVERVCFYLGSLWMFLSIVVVILLIHDQIVSN